jgi:hypothetical protein
MMFTALYSCNLPYSITALVVETWLSIRFEGRLAVGLEGLYWLRHSFLN